MILLYRLFVILNRIAIRMGWLYSPSLYFVGLRPTWKWVMTGNMKDCI